MFQIAYWQSDRSANSRENSEIGGDYHTQAQRQGEDTHGCEQIHILSQLRGCSGFHDRTHIEKITNIQQAVIIKFDGTVHLSVIQSNDHNGVSINHRNR